MDFSENQHIYSTDASQFSTAESLQYSLSLIQAITNNFSAENKIGEGGFGHVYKVPTLSLGGSKNDMYPRYLIVLINSSLLYLLTRELFQMDKR